MTFGLQTTALGAAVDALGVRFDVSPIGPEPHPGDARDRQGRLGLAGLDRRGVARRARQAAPGGLTVT